VSLRPYQRVRVSVCAAKNEEDVRAVVAGGADAVGVLVQTRHTAEDAVDLHVAAKILDIVPPYVSRYAVTHAAALEDLITCVDELPIDTLQLHDHVLPQVVTRLRTLRPHLRILKAVHVTNEIPSVQPWGELCDGLVFDTVNLAEDRIGGTGKVHDWRLTRVAQGTIATPVILAGGLTPENVCQAVRAVRPWAVNVNSGVELNGMKSEQLVREFVNAANRPQDQILPNSGTHW
jgi:phosphoribosylanthranilate isomerase